MTPCTHPRQNGQPLCHDCYHQMSVEARHFFGICLEARRKGLPLVTEPAKSVPPEQARWIAGLFGFSLGEPRQGALFVAERTVEAL